MSTSIVRKLPSKQLQARPPNRPRTHGRALKLLADIPHANGRIAQRFRKISEALLCDYQSDELSESRKQLIARFAACSALAEQYEAKMANNEPTDIPEYALVVSTTLRLAKQIEVNNKTGKVINERSLSEYLTANAEVADEH